MAFYFLNNSYNAANLSLLNDIKIFHNKENKILYQFRSKKSLAYTQNDIIAISLSFLNYFMIDQFSKLVRKIFKWLLYVLQNILSLLATYFFIRHKC